MDFIQGCIENEVRGLEHRKRRKTHHGKAMWHEKPYA